MGDPWSGDLTRWRAEITRSRFGWWVKFTSGLTAMEPPSFRWTYRAAERAARRGVRRLNDDERRRADPIVIT